MKNECRIKNLWEKFSRRKKTLPPAPWNLLPLTPSFFPEEHEGYVSALEAALNDSKILNVALSGNYGVGKSSILQELARRLKNRAVELSLSTLAPIEAEKVDDSIPIQATTPTNRIQQEIVKQLLYRENPSKTPGSRFKRITRFRTLRAMSSSVLLGLVLTSIFLLTGWTDVVTSTFGLSDKIGLYSHLIVWGIATVTTFFMCWIFHGQFQIKQFSAGAATVTLDDKSVSYFDQYLDEIVYFFEISKADVVIFEDIDRFNDSHIFDTLRALNTLLNASPNIKRKIRFIYAIKDSIFDRVGLVQEGRKLESFITEMNDSALADTVRANRTKFFDLVIPVVPFITHRSARNLATQLLNGIDHKVDPALLDLAARFVPDMRLLKNVRNEFMVFRNRIFSGDGQHLNLSETELFAMMLYKNTHLMDFEIIRLGTSQLDALYKISRDLVNTNIRKIENEILAFQKKSKNINEINACSTELGNRLLLILEKIVDKKISEWNYVTTTLDDNKIETAYLKEPKFWIDIIENKSKKLNIEFLDRTQRHYTTTSISQKEIIDTIKPPINLMELNKEEEKDLKKKINQSINKIKLLKGADFSDLIKNSEFKINSNENEKCFNEFSEQRLKRGLAYELVKAGYINRNFTLYTSTFHGDRISPEATNFIIHHIDRDLMDEHFELTAADVDAIVRERGMNSLKEAALYNVNLLDRLLASNTEAANIMVESIADLGERQRHFLEAYLTAGQQRLKFIEQFTRFYPNVLVYLVNEKSLDEASRLSLINHVLGHFSDPIPQTDETVSNYLKDNYSKIDVLISNATSPTQAELIASLFLQANAVLPELTPLGLNVREPFVSHDLYEITQANLKSALNNTTSLALDVIKNANSQVYKYVLNHLDKYLISSNGVSATVDSQENFISVLEEILENEASYLSDVIKHSAHECQINDIKDISEETWHSLVKHQRIPSTFNNVFAYINKHGSVDSDLSKLLISKEEIYELDDAKNERKVAVAVAILAAKDHGLSATLRSNLVEKMNLSEYLNMEDVAAESGELFSLLIKKIIVADEAETFKHLKDTDWQTRQTYIKNSIKFIDYMTPELICADISDLLSSNEIEPAIKHIIIENASNYAENAESPALQAMAQFAIQNDLAISQSAGIRMAQKGVAPEDVVSLLKPHWDSMDRDTVLLVLQAFGGDYAKLVDANAKRPRIPSTPASRSLLKRLRQDDFSNGDSEQI